MELNGLVIDLGPITALFLWLYTRFQKLEAEVRTLKDKIEGYHGTRSRKKHKAG